MKSIYLEHANITVKDLDAATNFFQTAFPHFEIRGGGISNGRKWIHLGDNDTYVALNEAIDTPTIKKNYANSGINHLGFVVDDVALIAKRLLAAGYQRDFPKQVEQFRIRDYFTDADGNEYEFVQYLSEISEERNSYA